jgi:hypothetical protein
MFSSGHPPYRLKGGEVVQGGRFISLPEPDPVGPKLPSSDKHLSIYKRWKQIIEVYSRTSLTKPADKLIALSGVAKMMSAQAGGTYLAGLWTEYLES